MRDDGIRLTDPRSRRAARLIVLELLSHAEGRTISALARLSPEIPSACLIEASAMLLEAGVIIRRGQRLNSSHALLLIDALQLIAI